MAQSRWKIPLIAAAIVVGLGGVVAGASELLNPPPGGPVPGHDATLSSTSQTYMEAAKSNDCGITRALTTSNTTVWCDRPRLLSYKFLRRTGDDGECMAYWITTDTGLDGTDQGASEPWAFCYRLTNAGRRLWSQGQG